MARIEVSRVMAAPPEKVWEELADLASHPEWMRDARGIEFLSETRQGVGTRVEVETRLGPFRTLDMMEVTGWDEGHSIEMEHRGLVRGRGVLSVTREREDRAVVSWLEDLAFPWWAGGELTALLAAPVLRLVFGGNLRRLEERLSPP